MQPMDTLDLSSLQSKLEVASLTNQQQSPRPDESSPVTFLNSPRSPAAMAVEPQPQSETAVQQQQQQPDLLKHSKVRKERRRNKTSSSAAKLAEHEPTRTCKRIRLRHKEEEEGPEKKGKDVVENEAVMMADDKSAPRVWNLRPRKVPECLQKKSEAASGSKADPKAALEEIKKFSVSHTKKEIEEDFLIMTSKKPSQKPKKRRNEEKKNIVVRRRECVAEAVQTLQHSILGHFAAIETQLNALRHQSVIVSDRLLTIQEEMNLLRKDNIAVFAAHIDKSSAARQNAIVEKDKAIAEKEAFKEQARKAQLESLSLQVEVIDLKNKLQNLEWAAKKD